MSNNEAMIASIRAKLSKHVFPGMLPEAINGMRWPEWDAMVATFTADYAKRRGCDLQKYATPDELRYIHENLTTEAFAKLGLKLPEKKLEYTIPTNLSPDDVAWLKASVNAGKCKYHGTFTHNTDVLLSCKTTCHKWTKRITCPPKSEYLEMFKTILDAQLPPLKYTVPDLDAEERKVVEELTELLADSCGKTTIRCTNCTPLMKKIFGERRCYIKNYRLGSPERTQFIDALKAVLEQQKPLLPHNVIQFAEPEYGNWKWWLKQRNGQGLCPSTRRSEISTADCKNQCCLVFLDVEPDLRVAGNCPCHRESPETTRTIIEQCIARGPKFEKYDAWRKSGDPLLMEKVIVFSEKDGVTKYEDSSGKMHTEFTTMFMESYTKTPPPPKEEFQQYVVAWKDTQNRETGVATYIVTRDDPDGELRIIHESGFKGPRYHSEADLAKHSVRFEHPAAVRDMLNKVLGKESMVEAIKAQLHEWSEGCEEAPDTIWRHKAFVYKHVLTFIADLERKAK